MQTVIHPKYNPNTKAKCACGATFFFGSTAESISTELCSACHPFYTGKQNLVDTAGKVELFLAKMKKATVPDKNKAKVSEAVKAAAGAKATRRTSALDGRKVVNKVKAGRDKELLEKAKQDEEKRLAGKKKTTKDDDKEVKKETATAPAEKAEEKKEEAKS